MKKCCLTRVLFGMIFGFFLSIFVMYSQLSGVKNQLKHDHKTCSICVCEKKCNCPHENDKCKNKCLCD